MSGVRGDFVGNQQGEQGTPVRLLYEGNSGTVRPLCATRDPMRLQLLLLSLE